MKLNSEAAEAYIDQLAALQLGSHSTSMGDGGKFTYEALNLVDGVRTVSDIRDWLAAELGAVSEDAVAEYLSALATTGVIRAN